MYDLKCDTCGRILGQSDVQQFGQRCGKCDDTVHVTRAIKKGLHYQPKHLSKKEITAIKKKARPNPVSA